MGAWNGAAAGAGWDWAGAGGSGRGPVGTRRRAGALGGAGDDRMEDRKLVSSGSPQGLRMRSSELNLTVQC